MCAVADSKNVMKSTTPSLAASAGEPLLQIAAPGLSTKRVRSSLLKQRGHHDD
jgi:hypothetical protein